MTGRQSFVGTPARRSPSDDRRASSRTTPPTASSWSRTSRPAGWTSSPTGSSRCCRSAACSAPSTPGRRCATTSGSDRARPGPARSGNRRWPGEGPADHADHPPAGPGHRQRKARPRRLREVVETAVLAEELGFDGFGVGERHERPFISSSPPVVLSHIAARTADDPAVHRGHHAEPAGPGPGLRGLRHPRPPLRRPAGADHRQGQRRRAGAAVPRHGRGPVGPQPRGLRAVPAAVAGGEGDLVRAVPAAAARRRDLAATVAAADPGLARQCHAAGSRSTSPPGTATRSSPPTSPTRSSRTPS